MALTPKREMFALAVAGGTSQSEAYRLIYSTSKMTANSIAVEAHRLAKIPNVSLRIRQVQIKLGEGVGWDKQRLIQSNGWVYEGAYGEGDWTGARAALAELAKLLGAYDQPEMPQAPVVNITEVLNINDFSQLTEEQAKALAGVLRNYIAARRSSESRTD